MVMSGPSNGFVIYIFNCVKSYKSSILDTLKATHFEGVQNTGLITLQHFQHIVNLFIHITA